MMGDNTDKSRSEAKARGDVRYFTGKPCPKGHVSERYVSGGACVACVYENSYRNMDEAKILRSEKSLKRKIELEERIKDHPLTHLPRSFKEARENGNEFYFTGKPCDFGHVDKRMSSSRKCFTCFTGETLENRLAEYERIERLRLSLNLPLMPQTKAEALLLKTSFYFTGTPCINGHVDKRSTSNSDCFTCSSIRGRKWVEENSDRLRERKKRWLSTEHGKKLTKLRRYYRLMRRGRNCDGDSPSQLKAWVDNQNKECFWCGKGDLSEFHVDHFHPLSKGGTNKLTNFVISCPTCNLRKAAKLPEDFMEEILSEWV